MIVLFVRQCFIVLLFVTIGFTQLRRKVDDKIECPIVKSIRNFDLEQIMGTWYVVQYYASSEEALPYQCMRAKFTMSSHRLDITMNFTYSFTDDPLNEMIVGNITWTIPNPVEPAHWVHSEDIYEGVYNTYILDSDYTSWALLLHCAEKSKMPRYLSSFIMSRQETIGKNVVSYLRDKLPRYDVDLSFMFDMPQDDCNSTVLPTDLPPALLAGRIPPSSRRHPMKHHHDL